MLGSVGFIIAVSDISVKIWKRQGSLSFYGHSYTKAETKKAAFLPNLRLNECLPYGGLRLFLQAAQTFLGKRAKFWHSFNDFTLHFNRIVL